LIPALVEKARLYGGLFHACDLPGAQAWLLSGFTGKSRRPPAPAHARRHLCTGEKSPHEAG
jgi:hypothetical protein